jgi:hypothetical protein
MTATPATGFCTRPFPIVFICAVIASLSARTAPVPFSSRFLDRLGIAPNAASHHDIERNGILARLEGHSHQSLILREAVR